MCTNSNISKFRITLQQDNAEVTMTVMPVSDIYLLKINYQDTCTCISQLRANKKVKNIGHASGLPRHNSSSQTCDHSEYKATYRPLS